jgi:hypothetical protein
MNRISQGRVATELSYQKLGLKVSKSGQDWPLYELSQLVHRA